MVALGTHRRLGRQIARDRVWYNDSNRDENDTTHISSPYRQYEQNMKIFMSALFVLYDDEVGLLLFES